MIIDEKYKDYEMHLKMIGDIERLRRKIEHGAGGQQQLSILHCDVTLAR